MKIIYEIRKDKNVMLKTQLRSKVKNLLLYGSKPENNQTRNMRNLSHHQQQLYGSNLEHRMS